MTNIEASVSHDHDYCASNADEEKAIDFVVENLLNSSINSPPPKSMDAENTDEMDSFGLSPAYSYDSGIDPFANDFVQGFCGGDEDLFNFLLDDDFGLETEPQQRTDLAKHGNSRSLKSAKVSPPESTKMVKPVGKKTFIKNGELNADARARKNAENARENRRKKKVYIDGLEKEVTQLRNEKNALMAKANKVEKKVHELQNEVDYLKSILANQSVLSKLIESVSMTPGVSLSTSFCSFRESSLKDHNIDCEKENSISTRPTSRKRACDSPSPPGAKRGRSSATGSGGICLHVKQNKVSLEFCRHCSKMASD